MAPTIAPDPHGSIKPELSATAMAEAPRRTPWNYVQDRNGKTMIEPVVGFYFHPPRGAKCLWSTEHGNGEAHHLEFAHKLPKRFLTLWDDKKLESEAAFYREKYWEDMKTLTAPRYFEDLYEYFDSATLWKHGTLNLWNLVNLLATDAQLNWHEHENHIAAECNNWLLDWLENFPAAQYNYDRLVRWNQQTDILTAVTTQYDWVNDLKGLELVAQNILRECFLFHFERLTGKKPAVACFNHLAATDKPLPPTAPISVPAPAQGPVIASTSSNMSSKFFNLSHFDLTKLTIILRRPAHCFHGRISTFPGPRNHPRARFSYQGCSEGQRAHNRYHCLDQNPQTHRLSTGDCHPRTYGPTPNSKRG